MTFVLPPTQTIQQQVQLALDEDIANGDVTAQLIDETSTSTATVICRETGILCGIAWFNMVYQQLDSSIKINWSLNDGSEIQVNQTLCTVSGLSRTLLTGERTALNFLQSLSGTATSVYQYSQVIKGTAATLLDTRKTIPGLRLAQKYAVRCGGGNNHRTGLFDMVLIKENHISNAGSITMAFQRAKNLYPQLPIEVEVESLQELVEALDAGAQRILLDNMPTKMLREAVVLNQQRAKLEASGGITLQNIRSIAETGVDYISIGAITKHLRALDLSMRMSII